MPYGVSSTTWQLLPDEDKAGIRAGWIAAGGNADGSGSAGGITSAGTPTSPPAPAYSPPPAAPAGGATPALVILPGGAVYWTGGSGNVYRWVPNPPTFGALGLSWADAVNVDVVPGYIATPWPSSDGSTPTPPPLPPNLGTDALVPPGVNVPQGFLGAGVTLIPAIPRAGFQPGQGDSPDAGEGDVLEEFSLDAEGRVNPGLADTKLPSGAWADLRDYLVKDQPFVGSHVRALGRGLRDVVASDLWTST